MNCVIYARVSSKEQEKEGFSIPAQRKKCKEYAEDHGYAVAAEFVDVESAKRAGRKDFNNMIEFLRKHADVDAVIAHKVDRLCRNFRDYVTVDDLPVKVVFVEEEFADNAAGKLTFGMKVLLAKHYIDNLSDETKKGLNEKIEQGFWASKAPLGYINNKQMHTIEPEPVLSVAVKKAFQLYSTGEMSLKTLARKLNSEFGRSLGNRRPFSKTHLQRILSNPIYTGWMRWKGRLVRGVHEPLITRDTFDMVQEALSHRSKPKARKHSFAFSGLMTCAHCGCVITAEVQKGRYVYYHCTGAKGECKPSYIREEELEPQFQELVAQINITPETADWLIGVLRSSHEDEKKHHKSEIRTLQREYGKLQDLIDKAYQQYLEGEIDKQFWQRVSEKWRERQTSIQDQIGHHSTANASYLESAGKLIELAQSAERLYVRQEPAEKRKLLAMLLSNCTLDGTTICPTYRKPFDIIADGAKTGEWGG